MGCAACHAGGNNSIVPEKKIKKAELEKYLTGGYKVEAIQYQVTNGKNSMPAFGDKLGPDDIEDVATYVYNRRTSGEPHVGVFKCAHVSSQVHSRDPGGQVVSGRSVAAACQDAGSKCLPFFSGVGVDAHGGSSQAQSLSQ